jgi:hypothetical protein
VLRRLESSVRVFRGELQTIHDLLYASRMEPDEESLESLLANLVICLQSLVELNNSRPTGNGRRCLSMPVCVRSARWRRRSVANACRAIMLGH